MELGVLLGSGTMKGIFSVNESKNKSYHINLTGFRLFFNNLTIFQTFIPTYMVVRSCPTKGHFDSKNTRNAFLPLNLPFVGQPDNHIG